VLAPRVYVTWGLFHAHAAQIRTPRTRLQGRRIQLRLDLVR
jgi:hypothetical protein